MYVFDTGESAVTFTEISPVFEDENGKNVAVPVPGVIVPLKVSTVFFDGSTMPPQLSDSTPASASAAAADNRARMPRILH